MYLERENVSIIFCMILPILEICKIDDRLSRKIRCKEELEDRNQAQT